MGRYFQINLEPVYGVSGMNSTNYLTQNELSTLNLFNYVLNFTSDYMYGGLT